MINIQSIQTKIYEIRGERVMLDMDLATLYEVEIRVLNQSVKRNLKRFPQDFMFQLTKVEFDKIKFMYASQNNAMSSQIVMTYTTKGQLQPFPMGSPNKV